MHDAWKVARFRFQPPAAVCPYEETNTKAQQRAHTPDTTTKLYVCPCCGTAWTNRPPSPSRSSLSTSPSSLPPRLQIELKKKTIIKLRSVSLRWQSHFVVSKEERGELNLRRRRVQSAIRCWPPAPCASAIGIGLDPEPYYRTEDGLRAGKALRAASLGSCLPCAQPRVSPLRPAFLRGAAWRCGYSNEARVPRKGDA